MCAKQTEQANDDKVNGDDVVKKPRHGKNQDSSDQRNEGASAGDDVHDDSMRLTVPVKEILAVTTYRGVPVCDQPSVRKQAWECNMAARCAWPGVFVPGPYAPLISSLTPGQVNSMLIVRGGSSPGAPRSCTPPPTCLGRGVHCYSRPGEAGLHRLSMPRRSSALILICAPHIHCGRPSPCRSAPTNPFRIKTPLIIDATRPCRGQRATSSNRCGFRIPRR